MGAGMIGLVFVVLVLAAPTAAAGFTLSTPAPATFVGVETPSMALSLVHAAVANHSLFISAGNATLSVVTTRLGTGEILEENRTWLSPRTIVSLERGSWATITSTAKDLGTSWRPGPGASDVTGATFLAGANPARSSGDRLRSEAGMPAALVPEGAALLVPGDAMSLPAPFLLDMGEGNLSVFHPNDGHQLVRAGRWHHVQAHLRVHEGTRDPVVVQQTVEQRVVLQVFQGILHLSPPDLQPFVWGLRPGHEPRPIPGDPRLAQLRDAGLPSTFANWELHASLTAKGQAKFSRAFGAPGALDGQDLALPGPVRLTLESVQAYPTVGWYVAGAPVPATPGDGAWGSAGWTATALGWAFAAGALLGAVRWLRRSIPWVGLTFLAGRMAEPEGHPVRKALVAVVRQHPGITVRALWARTDVSWTTFRFHLGLLLRSRVLASVRNRGLRFLFVPGGHHAADWNGVGLLRRPAMRRVAAHVAASEGASLSETARELSEAPSTVWVKLRKLVESGLVECIRQGRVTRYRPGPRLRQLLAPTPSYAVDPRVEPAPGGTADAAAPC